MQSHTKNWQRIAIWVITLAMAFGSVGFYFLIIMQNNSSTQNVTSVSADTEEEEQAKVDPSAYKVDGDVAELQITDLKVGDGQEVKAGDNIRFHYKGTIAQTGVKFDSSYDRGEPLDYPLTGLIKGWQEGIPGMKVGGKRRLVIPSELGYGAQSTASIPANSDLVFEIEVLAILPAETTE